MRVLAAHRTGVHLWDLDAQQDDLYLEGGLPPFLSYEPSQAAVVARWAPLASTPHFIFATTTGSLNLVDNRYFRFPRICSHSGQDVGSKKFGNSSYV
jgi:hypothetical protein